MTWEARTQQEHRDFKGECGQSGGTGVPHAKGWGWVVASASPGSRHSAPTHPSASSKRSAAQPRK